MMIIEPEIKDHSNAGTPYPMILKFVRNVEGRNAYGVGALEVMITVGSHEFDKSSIRQELAAIFQEANRYFSE